MVSIYSNNVEEIVQELDVHALLQFQDMLTRYPGKLNELVGRELNSRGREILADMKKYKQEVSAQLTSYPKETS